MLIGYDIGCGFSVTANNSPTIGPEIQRANLSFCVNAFHGHAHHRRCQLRWHPLYITGVGLEDFETCERVFSESNKIAACTRLASTFHRRQAILRHFRRWNAEKYAGLSEWITFVSLQYSLLITTWGQFIASNYKQATENIEKLTKQLESAKAALNIAHDDTFEQWHCEEASYLAALREAPIRDSLAATYVNNLKKLASLRFVN